MKAVSVWASRKYSYPIFQWDQPIPRPLRQVEVATRKCKINAWVIGEVLFQCCEHLRVMVSLQERDVERNE